MWNVLIVIIIAIIIWMLNPFAASDLKPNAGVDKKTQTQINSIESKTQQQLDNARQIQQQEQKNIDN